MKSPPQRPRPVVAKPLTAAALCHDFGGRVAVAREGVRILHDALIRLCPSALTHWKTLFGKWAGRALDKIPAVLAQLARRHGIVATAGAAEAPLLALQTYYALLVTLVAQRFAHGCIDELLPDNPFAWHGSIRSAPVERLVDRMREMLAEYRLPEYLSLADGDCDLFKPLYQAIFPRALRHQLGEYYTPDWLARHVLDQVGYEGMPGQRLLDPACGSGTFLVMALRRMRGQWRGEKGEKRTLPPSFSPLPSPLSPPFQVVGFDLNPLAVLTARANYLLAIADMLPAKGPVEIPVYLCDSILGVPAPTCAATPFDFVAGNPPWIAWDNLPADDRQATKPLWERYGLFSLSGNEARHGGGKKDLSMLMLYATADRYLKAGGRLGMVVTQTLFQTKGAGDGFRRFRLGPDGPPLRVLRVDDMVALRPFGDAANRTSTIALEKGKITEYPVPYIKWEPGREERERGKGTAEWPGGRGAAGATGQSPHQHDDGQFAPISPLSSLLSPLPPSLLRPPD